MADLLDQTIAELARRRRCRRRVAALLPALAVSLGLGAVLVLTVRLALPELARADVWIAAVAAAAPLLAAPSMGRRPERRAQLAGRLDNLIDARGLAMALAERPADRRDPGWTDRLRRRLEAVPWPRADWSRLPLVALAAACLAGALLLPQRAEQPPPAPPPWQVHFERTHARLDAAGEAGLMPDAQRRRLADQIARLEEIAAEGGMSQASWEGLDRADRAIERAVETAEARLAEAITAASTAHMPRAQDPPPEAGAPLDPDEPDGPRRRRDRDRLKPKRPDAAGDEIDSQRVAARRLLERLTRERERERLSSLAKSLSQLGAQAPGLAPRLSPEAHQALERLMEQAAARGALDDEALRALEALMRRAAEAPGAQGGQGRGEQGHDGPRAGPEQGLAQLGAEDIDKLLDELEQALKAGRVTLGQAGAGGDLDALIARLMVGATAAAVSRGPGHVALTRSGEDPGEAGGIARLPPGAHANPDGSVTIAETARAPELDEAALRALARGRLQHHAPANADARRAHVAPRHRGAVGRYFSPHAPGAAD
ncbi:MAG: hypothetical protein CSA66_04730 [Proteobacteria bacterium]|nr:MAG: hypothetical protein CSA66_04730 [Pseudomonadota bacterium]